MLTATEKQRVKNFTSNMDDDTAEAMFNLFEITKPGCTPFTNDLCIAAHTGEPLPTNVVGAFFQYRLVNKNGTIPKPVRQAIKKAVAESYLVIHNTGDPALRPDPLDLVYH